jgi:hypothetical protein
VRGALGARLLCRLACRCLWSAGTDAADTESGGKARVLALPRTGDGDGDGDGAAPVDVDVELAGGAPPAGGDGGVVEEEMYLAGQVVHVRGTPGEIVAVSPFAFREIEVTPTFLLDHVPWRLQAEMAALLGCTWEGDARTKLL